MDFESIYQCYFKDVFLYICSLSANEHVAEDVTQEAFAKALKSIDHFDGSKDIRAWLFTIAKNTYYTYCKRQKIYTGYEPSDNMPSPQEVFTVQLIDEERAFLIHRFLHDMKDPYKEVFSLRVFGELPFDKIALLFGKTPSWARVTYYRAKKQIIMYMEDLDNGKIEL